MARERPENAPQEIKTDSLASYRDAVPRTFPTRPFKPVVTKGIRAEINNNLSEKPPGTPERQAALAQAQQQENENKALQQPIAELKKANLRYNLTSATA